jgi:hypothetical protein
MPYDDDPSDPVLARLIAAHPALFRGAAPVVSSHLPAGWYDLVDKLCHDIESTLGAEGCASYEVRQVKSKFGALRFYWADRELGATDVHIDLIGSGALESVVQEIGPDDAKLERVRGLIRAAEQSSMTFCETCGEPGTLMKPRGWYITRCAKHMSSGE